jgi:hypothetical protein
MPNPYNVRLIRVGDVQRRRKNKEDDAANLKIAPFPMLLASTHLNAINQPNKSYLQRPHLCACLSLSQHSFLQLDHPPQSFPCRYRAPEHVYDSVAATSTPLLPRLGAKLPSILRLASCISAFVGLSFC